MSVKERVELLRAELDRRAAEMIERADTFTYGDDPRPDYAAIIAAMDEDEDA